MTVTSRSTIVVLLLVLSVISLAIPTNTNTQRLTPPDGSSDVIKHIDVLQTDVDLIARTIAELTVVTDVAAFIKPLTDKVNTCAENIFVFGGRIDLDPGAQADAVVKLTAIITVLLSLSMKLVARFGVRLALDLLTKIDACLLTLISILSVCAKGALAPIPDIFSSPGFAQIYITLSTNVLESAGL